MYVILIYVVAALLTLGVYRFDLTVISVTLTHIL